MASHNFSFNQTMNRQIDTQRSYKRNSLEPKRGKLFSLQSQAFRDDRTSVNKRFLEANLNRCRCIRELSVGKSGSCQFTFHGIDFVVFLRRDGKAFSMKCRIYRNGDICSGLHEDVHEQCERLRNQYSKQSTSLKINCTQYEAIELTKELSASYLHPTRRSEFDTKLVNFLETARTSQRTLEEKPNVGFMQKMFSNRAA